MLRAFTGMRVTNKEGLHLGNYFGALKPLFSLNATENIFFAADLHTITTNKVNRNFSLDLIGFFLAANPELPNVTLFVQSDYMEFTYLQWILCNITSLGQLYRMTQFKDKSQKSGLSTNAGLLLYPTLMAADVLTWCDEKVLVPVGIDQKQHMEFIRDIAESFNKKYGQTFILPEIILGDTPKIHDLRTGEKMSKSNNNRGTICFSDSDEIIAQKIKEAVTDSLPMPKNTTELETRININKLLDLYTTVTNHSKIKVLEEFGGAQTSYFKRALAHEIISFVAPIRNRFISMDKDYIIKQLQLSAPTVKHQLQKCIEIVKANTIL